MTNTHLEPGDMIMYGGVSDKRDTCEGLTDDQICEALQEEPILLPCAKWLSQKVGRIVTRSSIVARIKASPRLQCVHLQSQKDYDERMVSLARRNIATYRVAKRVRDDGPRCGAQARSGRPCQRKVVLSRSRCPNHGGHSTGPKTPEGKARSAKGRQQRWAKQGGDE